MLAPGRLTLGLRVTLTLTLTTNPSPNPPLTLHAIHRGPASVHRANPGWAGPPSSGEVLQALGEPSRPHLSPPVDSRPGPLEASGDPPRPRAQAYTRGQGKRDYPCRFSEGLGSGLRVNPLTRFKPRAIHSGPARRLTRGLRVNGLTRAGLAEGLGLGLRASPPARFKR